MKSAKTYATRIRKLTATARRKKLAIPEVPLDEGIRLIVEAILEADAGPRLATKAIKAIETEFVDFNEMRAAPIREVFDCLGKSYPFGRRKARRLSESLNLLFRRANGLSLGYLETMPRREARRHLRELGLGSYAAAQVARCCFGTHAIPVDKSLADALEIDDAVPEGATREDVQSLLERTISRAENESAHQFFRQYVGSHAKALEKKWKKEAEQRAAELEAAEKAAEAKAAKEAAKEQAAREAAETKANAAKARAKASGKSASKTTQKKATPASSKPKAKTTGVKTSTTAKKKPKPSPRKPVKRKATRRPTH